MKAPQRIPLAELNDWFVEEIERHYKRDKFNGFRCRLCDLPVRWATANLSIHFDGFPDCAGPGTVVTRPLPYCFQCEEVPDGAGCVHTPLTSERFHLR